MISYTRIVTTERMIVAPLFFISVAIASRNAYSSIFIFVVKKDKYQLQRYMSRLKRGRKGWIRDKEYKINDSRNTTEESLCYLH